MDVRVSLWQHSAPCCSHAGFPELGDFLLPDLSPERDVVAPFIFPDVDLF